MSEADALIAHATDLADADLRLRRALTEIRRARSLSQRDVADRMGVKRGRVRRFETYSYPRFGSGFVRRYALAVGADITHTVTPRKERS